MGSVCSSMSNTFSGAEPDQEQYTTRTRPTQKASNRRVNTTTSTMEEQSTPAAMNKINSKSVLKSSDNKSTQSDFDSFSDEFVPVDEEQLYIDSYWWAEPKDFDDDDAPWNNTKAPKGNLGTASNKGQISPDKNGAAAGGVDPVSSESKLEHDPFENHPFFTMDIKRLTKPKSNRTKSMKNVGVKKSSKEKEKESSKNADDLAKYQLVYDDKKVPNIYPVLGDIRKNVDAKCHSIHEAFKSDPDDRDKKLIKVYSTLSVIDRAFIPEQYKVLFSEPLASQIKAAISGPFGNLILSLSYTIEDAEIEMIRTALSSNWKHRNEHLLRVLCGRGNQEIIKLKDSYEKTTEKNMDSIVKELQKGAFRDYIKMCLKKNACEKYQPKKKHIKENAKKVAKELYDCGEKRFGTDNDEFLGIFVRNPPPFLRLIDAAYEEKYKKSIKKAIKNELSFSAEVAVLYGVGMSLDPFDMIAKTMEKTFKGVGMDPIGFNSLIVRYHPYLKIIAEKYEDRYNRTLLDSIHYEAKGHYHDLLCKILENAFNDVVDEEDDEEVDEQKE